VVMVSMQHLRISDKAAFGHNASKKICEADRNYALYSC